MRNEKTELDYKKIQRFALVWGQMYKNHANVPWSFFEDCFFVGDSMMELGFDMDSGESLIRAFPDCNYSDLGTWRRISLQIDSVKLLGDAIFSYWRYWNHWAMSPMSEDDFEWFVVGFERLAELAARSAAE
ncbi:MAG: hypothetical protein E7225_04635 [Clostridiales bacterium]|nr:hypothetical protein [Clostridiales bacterium]